MSSVRQLFAAAGLDPSGPVPWGDRVALDEAGVYAVSSTDDPDNVIGPESATMSVAAVNELLDARPELRLDGKRPSTDALLTRLASMWLPGEPTLYIGMTSASVRTRVNAYYRTKLGARRPHAGGWPIKVLANIDDLFVFFAGTPKADRAEGRMIGAFVSGLASTAFADHCDPALPIPFANLEYPKGARKRHGITGARERGTGTPSRSIELTVLQDAQPIRMKESTPTLMTQRITDKDIHGGRIRVPAASKVVMPSSLARLRIDLRGSLVDAAWDPRVGPDRERSGVLLVSRALLGAVVEPNEQLAMQRDGEVLLLR